MKWIFYLSLVLLLCPLHAFSRNRPFNGEIKALISHALKDGKKRIEIPNGVWLLDLKDGRPLLLEGLNSVVIAGDNAEIVCNVPSQAIEIRNCRDLTISGLRIDYDPLPFTQGRIIRMDTVQRLWLDVEIHQGYRTDMIEDMKPDRFQIFDGTTHSLRKNLYTYFSSSFGRTEKIGEGRFRFHKATYNKDACEMPGDDVVFSLPYPTATRMHAIVSTKCSNIQFKDVILYASNCFGFFETDCERNAYINCQVNVKEHDSLYDFPRLRSANADAIHSKHALKGPIIQECKLLWQGDDGIAINTSFFRVLSSSADQVSLEAGEQGAKIGKGHRVRFVDSTGGVMGDAKVLNIRGGYHLFSNEGDKERKKSAGGRQVFTLTLNRAVVLPSGVLISSIDAAGNQFLIANNTIGYTRARGILVKSSHGRIIGNTVVGCELGGIVLAPELSWMEAGFSRNVLIRNNLIKDCMFANSSYGIEQAASISVVAINRSGYIAPSDGFRKIRIVNNRICNTPLPAIMMTSAGYSLIKRNRIETSRQIIRTHGRHLGADNETAIWLKNTRFTRAVRNEVQ